jgi:hypothetical protein
MRSKPVAVTIAIALLTAVAEAGSLPPRRKARLLAWLEQGTYRELYRPEPSIHVSEAGGAHGRYVRTYYSPILVEDLQAGRTPFRKGAAMVKEFWDAAQVEVVGWSVMRKLGRRSGRTGIGWLFYETFDRTNRGALFGRGKGVCVGCHRSGTDYLLSTFRP